jgi:hypothetical protein
VRLLAKEYDGKMPPEPVPAPEPARPEVVTVAASVAPSPAAEPAKAPQEPAVAVVVPPVVPLPQVGTGLAKDEEPRPWWVRLLVWLVGALTGRR